MMEERRVFDAPIPDMPADTPLYMAPAYLSALGWALCEESGEVERFRAMTGNQYRAPSSGLDAMIDAATGADAAFMAAFVGWFNEFVWGPIDGPEDDT